MRHSGASHSLARGHLQLAAPCLHPVLIKIDGCWMLIVLSLRPRHLVAGLELASVHGYQDREGIAYHDQQQQKQQAEQTAASAGQAAPPGEPDSDEMYEERFSAMRAAAMRQLTWHTSSVWRAPTTEGLVPAPQPTPAAAAEPLAAAPQPVKQPGEPVD